MLVRANWAHWEVAGCLLLLLINNMVWYLIGAQSGVLADTDTVSIFRYWYRYQTTLLLMFTVTLVVSFVWPQAQLKHRLSVRLEKWTEKERREEVKYFSQKFLETKNRPEKRDNSALTVQRCIWDSCNGAFFLHNNPWKNDVPPVFPEQPLRNKS